MKYQILFSWKNKKNVISLSSAEFAHIVVSVKDCLGHTKAARIPFRPTVQPDEGFSVF